MNAVPVARDYGGLKRAAVELLEEARVEPQRQKMARLAEYAQNSEQLLENAAQERSLAEGYYQRLGYLVELESVMQVGGLDAAILDMSEMRGLMALAAARREFDSLHPPCKRCGVRLENEGETQCQECWQAEMKAGR